MTFDEYEAAAARTVNAALSPAHVMLDAAAGLAEEAGEVLGLVRKHVFQEHALERERLAKELGDALWCLTIAARAADVSLADVAAANLEKLRRRYPDGFTPAASAARADERGESGRAP
jgi:NTP pyrophosphatase (non-canonical NTP hydrolase)